MTQLPIPQDYILPGKERCVAIRFFVEVAKGARDSGIFRHVSAYLPHRIGIGRSRVDDSSRARWEVMQTWIIENTHGLWMSACPDEWVIYFERSQDAMLFKLRFSDGLWGDDVLG